MFKNSTMSIMSKELLKSIGKNIRNMRKNKKLSQEKLAEKIEMSRNALGSIERGETNIPILTLNKIYSALGKDLSTLFK